MPSAAAFTFIIINLILIYAKQTHRERASSGPGEYVTNGYCIRVHIVEISIALLAKLQCCGRAISEKRVDPHMSVYVCMCCTYFAPGLNFTRSDY